MELQGFAILDGGLATELEYRGHDLNHALWSAKLLAEHPTAISEVHTAWLEAGADCITTASYQASIPGFMNSGLSEADSADLILESATIALRARDKYFEQHQPAIKPVVAASIGPYGAFLSDGSEYTGAYCVDEAALRAYHEPRWNILARSEIDLMAIETIPNAREAAVLLELLQTTPAVSAWVSFSCNETQKLCDGTPLGEVAAAFSDCPQVVAVGVNCIAPRQVLALIDVLGDSKPIIVYPNSGERYEPINKSWTGEAEAKDFAHAARGWYERGAKLIGGCCRTRPAHIGALKNALKSHIRTKNS